MIIACPSCDTRFEVNAAAFPPGGRKVKCARCAHVWHAASPAGVPVQADAIELEEPMPETIAPPTVVPRVEETPDVMIWAGSDIPPRRSSRLQTIGIAAACIAVLAAGLTIFRESVVAFVPAIGPAYAAIGLPVDLSGLNLEIEAQAMEEAGDGATTLVVKGRVANVSSEERPVPQIRATLFSKENAELHSWTFDPGVKTLKPGETHEFEQKLAQPPADTYQVYAHFADES
jgi:predicted Zn finger-like uncharacterized protein